MIYLNPQNRSSLGDDTFWTWFHREFPSSFDIPEQIGSRDVVLQYSVMGRSHVQGGTRVALLWELHPEMIHQRIEGHWDPVMDKIRDCERHSDRRVVSSPTMRSFYESSDLLPIGVDTDLFCPRNKKEMRDKHGYGDGTYGFWCGTTHQMKGYDRFQSYAASRPEIKWISVMKEQALPQATLAELMCCADFGLFTGRLRPYFMVEWEMMSCDLPIVDISGMERDFAPGGREKVLELGWSRHQAKEAWAKYLAH